MSTNGALTQAEARGYVEARNNALGRAIADGWVVMCRAAHRPYVRVTPAHTRGIVSLDMEPSGQKLNAAGKAAIRQAIGSQRSVPGFFTYGDRTRVGGLYVADCHVLAAAFVAIATDAQYLAPSEPSEAAADVPAAEPAPGWLPELTAFVRAVRWRAMRSAAPDPDLVGAAEALLEALGQAQAEVDN